MGKSRLIFRFVLVNLLRKYKDNARNATKVYVSKNLCKILTDVKTFYTFYWDSANMIY